LRPSKDVHILADFIKPEVEAPRTLWSTKVPFLSFKLVPFITPF
jgi:long-chain acyl-CoA synthetase